MGIARLAEITEDRATGTLAETYDDIRAVLGVPFVSLVYRAVAVVDGRLDAVWEAVRPNLLSELTHQLAAALGTVSISPVPRVDGAVVAESGLDLQLAADTLAAFHRANTRNAIVLWALQGGHDGGAPPLRRPAPRTSIPQILPMADLASLSASASALLTRMSVPIAGAEPPVVIPSLLRCFAFDEPLLAALCRSLRPLLESDAYREHVSDVRTLAQTSAAALPYGVAPCPDAEAQQIIDRFLRTIPAMIAAAPMIAAALSVDLTTRPHGAHVPDERAS